MKENHKTPLVYMGSDINFLTERCNHIFGSYFGLQCNNRKLVEAENNADGFLVPGSNTGVCGGGGALPYVAYTGNCHWTR